MTVSIKKVDKKSFPFLIKLIKQLASFESLTPPDKKAVQRLENDCLSMNPKIDSFIAYQENQAVGYMIILMSYSSFLALPTLYIEDLFVAEEQRGSGIGQALIDYAKGLAKERGCGRIELHVLDWNDTAIKFYEKNKLEAQKDQLLYRLVLNN